MNRRRLVAVLVAAVAAIGIAGASIASPPRTYLTHLTGSEEVPARETVAKGVAIFEVAPDGESIRYQLVSTRIENAFMAHIHAASFGTNGGIVVWLWPSTTPGAPGPLGSGIHNGLMTTGTITADNLVGALAGQDLDALISLLASGGAYVNVHTNDGDPNTSNIPGDFGGGEIRGQID